MTTETSDDIDDVAPVGRREAGKAARRERIIQVARELIRETGDAGLSMRALAARSGVSLATPYSLFGSRRAIVLALLPEPPDLDDDFSRQRITDPLERLFHAVGVFAEAYLADPALCRAVVTAALGASDDLLANLWDERRDGFWTGLLAATVEAGAINPEIDQAWLLRQLDRVLRCVLIDWVLGRLASDAVVPAAHHGCALILKGAAAPEWSGPLTARILATQERLLALESG
jgi:AcrR family transcriptional regulator